MYLSTIQFSIVGIAVRAPFLINDCIYAVSGDCTSQLHFVCVVCQAVLPVESLLGVKQSEKDSEIFTEMPCEHYMEVASLLLNQ